MKRIILTVFVGASLGGCFGIDTPTMEEPLQQYGNQRLFENIIVQHVKCELRQGLEVALNDDLYKGHRIDWLRNYGAKVTLKITSDEKSAVSPNIALTNILPNATKIFPFGGNVTRGQSFAVGLGGTLSANATRAESIGFTYDFQSLIKNESFVAECPGSNGFQINSNLRIAEFIRNKVFIARVPGATYPIGSASPFNTFNYEVTFVSSFGGSLNPTWTFLEVAATGSPMFSAARTKTHYLNITLGPAIPGTRSRPPILYQQAEDVHIASLIGQSVANAIASQQR
ncbi:hypothetical protein JHFBIEKO_2210 [Methylobacterium mesophilicum]|uniref:hypothetical protein n=1 Tax=Methylobacterium mesophilicum TaxID=39956 RepID=UPI001EE1B7E6|nr:hypothetical protein [Methylobacterium mesophilicum]GJE21762.1 hypothetical protein JHFBIEKO_2210 [Methylobacterium mesophilicum]